MKKIILILAVLFAMTACTEQQRSREFGGDVTIKLKPGEKLVEATWKDDNLWYLTEPMESDYTPKTKTFTESSSFGIFEGTVTFVERR